MLDERIEDINPEELEKAEEDIRKEWGYEIEEKLDKLLEYRITQSEGGIESQQTQRVLICYKTAKDFEALDEEFQDFCEKYPDNELEPEFTLIERNFEQSASRLIKSLEDEGIKIEEHLVLCCSVVARLTPAQVNKIAQLEDVKHIESDKFMVLELDQSVGTIGLVEAREKNLVQTGKGIKVAVVDGEIDDSHPDLQGRVTRKRNYTDEPWGNPHPHGTHVAGIIAGNGEKYKGMAPEAEIWSYKIYKTKKTESEEFEIESAEGFTSADAIEDAVKDGAKVINCSWGVHQTNRDGTCIWCKTAERAAKLGVVVVKSAGNSGPNQQTTTCPANALGDVIVVGATSKDGKEITEFSSRGPTADNRPKPDIIAPGGKIISAKVGGGYIAKSGTSMAAPHVSGIAALMLEQNPQLKPWQIKKILMETAKLLDSSENGSGELDSNIQGKGLVDVVKALEKVKQPTQPGQPGVESLWLMEIPNRKFLSLKLKNSGTENMLDVKATLKSDTPEIRMVKDKETIDCGKLRMGAEKELTYEIEVTTLAKPGPYKLTLETHYTSPSGQSKSLTCEAKYLLKKS